jgi:DUF917 family protein
MQLDAASLPLLARGCAVLGAGGGGDVSTGLAAALQAVETYGPVELVAVEELPADGLIMPCGFVGAPTVSIEKLGNGVMGERLRDRLEAATGRPVVAVMADEIGGSNGLQPVAWAARLGLPLVDADGMGRAFPEMHQVTMHVAGVAPGPCVVADERGNTLVVHPADGAWLERIVRAVAVAFGGSAASSAYPLGVEEAARATIHGSVSLAVRVGRALESGDDPVSGLIRELDARCLLRGRVDDVERRTTGGFVRGSVLVAGLGEDADRLLRIEIQNENLVALEEGRVLASVPDLIVVLDSQSGEAISTERLRYGQRVTAIAFPCDPVWRTPAGLEVAGPRAFGYDFDYVAVEELGSP